MNNLQTWIGKLKSLEAQEVERNFNGVIFFHFVTYANSYDKNCSLLFKKYNCWLPCSR